MRVNVAIVGCGLIGHKRARGLASAQLTVACDAVADRAISLAKTLSGCTATANREEAVARPDIDVVVVATTHNLLAPIAAAPHGKHVLIEKPGARSAAELDCIYQAARRSGALVRVGFNHRYHRALRKAREIFDSGVLGQPMFVRGRYGHGGHVRKIVDTSITKQFLAEAAQILERLDADAIESLAALLAETRSQGGRLFVLGVGGSAANASHAVNDFRELASIEAYAPTGVDALDWCLDETKIPCI